MHFQRFSVEKLHGTLSYDVTLADNRLVIIGENGTGKTTLMNLMYYFLSGQWGKLADYRFESLTAHINGERFDVPRSLFPPIQYSEKASYRRFGAGMERRVNAFLEALRGSRFDPSISAQEYVEHLADQFDLPRSIVREIIGQSLPLFDERQSKYIYEAQEKLRKLLDCQVLYLPTYRRIEQELKRIFPHIDIEETRRSSLPRGAGREDSQFIELIEFGMTDVVRALNSRRDLLKEYARTQLNQLTLSYLREIIDFEHQSLDVSPIRNVNEATVNVVIDRIDENILPSAEKDRLRQIITTMRSQETSGEHSKIVGHFFLKLLALQEKQFAREAPIRKFAELCNVYLRPHKEFVYDDATFEVSVVHNRSDQRSEGQIGLQDLSSGEKQIVSLFSHLILSEGQKYFVLIDEPELSLSVPWQQRFLVDIINCGRTSGLVAVTHSPFIYENLFDSYAHGINEFRRPA